MPRSTQFLVVMGACSGDPDVYPGIPVIEGASVEWQVSDGMPGERGSSSDHVDPLRAFNDMIEQRTAARFITAREAAIFGRDLVLRLAGVPITDLDLVPRAAFFQGGPAVEKDAHAAGMYFLVQACRQAGLPKIGEAATVMMKCLVQPSFPPAPPTSFDDLRHEARRIVTSGMGRLEAHLAILKMDGDAISALRAAFDEVMARHLVEIGLKAEDRLPGEDIPQPLPPVPEASPEPGQD